MTKEELVLWRKSRGMTQKMLADGLGVDIKTLGRWERGENRIPAGVLVKLEQAAPGGMEKLRSAMPADEPIKWRWRPYPGLQSNRDYTLDEIERLPVGTRVWLLETDAACWQVRFAWKKGRYISDEQSYAYTAHGTISLTLPIGAFPDSLGAPAPWMADVYNTNKANLDAARRRLVEYRREIGDDKAV